MASSVMPIRTRQSTPPPFLPVALTLGEADDIIRTASEVRVKLMIPFNPRFQLPLMKVKEALDSGQAGEMVSPWRWLSGRQRHILGALGWLKLT